MVLPRASATLAHIGCRTGYPDGELGERIPGAEVTGIDPSPAALDLARTKAALHNGIRATYHAADNLPTSLPAASFTHAITIHPVGGTEERAHLLSELRRLLVPGGQAIVAMPLRGSFPEITDMLREYALRLDSAEIGAA